MLSKRLGPSGIAFLYQGQKLGPYVLYEATLGRHLLNQISGP